MRGIEFLLGIVLLSLLGCVPVTEFHDPDNRYTPASSFQKEVINYPHIHIASSQLPSEVKVFRNLSYVRYGRRHLQLDIYAPTNAGDSARPAVVLVHGGGWRAGYRQNLAALAIALAERGYVAATISYRLSPEAPYPAAIHDVKAAIRWLRSQAQVYGVDAAKIALAGTSAGGQIAALTGVTNGLATFDPQASMSAVPSDVQAIVNIDGLSDFTLPEALKYEDDPRKNPSAAGQWFGGRYAEKPHLWREASPIHYVRDGLPPILFIHSSQTRFSLGREQMIEKLQAHAVPYHVEGFAESPHTFWLFDPWLKPTAGIIADFLDQHFYGSLSNPIDRSVH